jgi:hypothetical protein
MFLSLIAQQAAEATRGNGGVVIDFTKDAATQGLFSGDLNASFGLFLSSVLRAIMVIAALSVLIFLIWGGMDWIFSGGEKAKIESARNKITGAVIGIVVLASSLAIFALVTSFLNIKEIQVSPSSDAAHNQNLPSNTGTHTP